MVRGPDLDLETAKSIGGSGLDRSLLADYRYLVYLVVFN